MNWQYWLWITLSLVVFASALQAADTVIDVSYSNRLVSGTNPPDTTIVEGGILATFAANNPIQLTEPDSSLTQLDDSTFTYTFVWNWESAKTVTFVDDLDSLITVVAWPRPAWPFDPTDHDVAVIHVQTDSANLWDPDTGIYVWGNYENFNQHGEEWERPATLDYYDAFGTLQVSEPVGLRINGHSSRYGEQKGFRFYFDGYGASSFVDYDFFGTEPTSFKRLLTRTGRYPSRLICSNWAEEIFIGLGYLGSRYTFVACYLNGEYWGGYSFKERYDDELIEHTHDVGDDYILIKDAEAVHGDINEWRDFLDSFSDPANYASHDWYTDKADQLDMVNYIDWMFLNIFGAPPDNGLWWNIVQLKIGDGKWQYLMWDEDTVLRAGNLNADYFRFFAAADSTEYFDLMPPLWGSSKWNPATEQWLAVFNHLMQNSEFKALFSSRVDYLLANEMSLPNLLAQIDAIVADQGPEVPFMWERWGWSNENSYFNQANNYKQWITDRYPIVVNQKTDFMEYFRVPVELSQFSGVGGNGLVDLTWRTESEENNRGFYLYRSVGNTWDMNLIASFQTHPELAGQLSSSTPIVYQFTDSTAVNNEINYYMLAHLDTESLFFLHDWVEPAWPTNWNGLVINELMADNELVIADEFAEYDDWFELYNGSTSTVYLDSLYVTDNLGEPTKHRFTGNHVMPPGGHLLFWADGDTTQGNRHCGFKLDDDGEELGLFAPNGLTIIDTVIYGEQPEDHSYERFPDGGDWTYAWGPTPEATNVAPRLERFLSLNELLAHNETINTDEDLEYDPWLEIYNDLPAAVNLSQLYLSDDPLTPLLWAIPDTVLAGGDHLLVWADDEPLEGPLHATFELDEEGGFLGFYSGVDTSAVDSLTFGEQYPDTALARIFDGEDNWEYTSNPTPGASNLSSYLPPLLYVNEFLAKNDSGIQDETGAYEDWCELYNAGPDTVLLGGMFLTDNLTNPTKWAFPDTFLAPSGFLLVWCDDDVGDGPLHASVKLGASGEEIGLFSRLADGNVLLDSYVFAQQLSDISEGRYPEGTDNWQFFTIPTPGASNSPLSGVGDGDGVNPTRFAFYPSYPNPASGSMVFAYDIPAPGGIPVHLDIFDLRGRRVRQLIQDHRPAGRHSVVWDRRDNQGRPTAAGVYFSRLIAGEYRATRKLLLIK